MKVAVVGTTAWGTALGLMLARKGMDVSLWARTKEEAQELDSARENAVRLPGARFPDSLSVTSGLRDAMDGASLVILAVPAQQMRHNAWQARACIGEHVPVLSVAKGLERETTKRMTEVIVEELGRRARDRVCAISGPNFSTEIAQGLPAATVLAAHNGAIVGTVRDILHSPVFRVEISSDLVGVEMAGALKNVIALGAGMMDAINYGDNAKAAFATRGLAEITRLSVAAGASPITLNGLAGVGDLLATCSSRLSRNRTFGEELAKGRPLADIRRTMTSVVEGIDTTVAALKLAKELSVEMPIAEKLHQVLFEGHDLVRAMDELVGHDGV